jgi:fumarate hydratase, class II
LKDAALKLGYISEAEFNRIVDPMKMVKPYIATGSQPESKRKLETAGH